MKLNRETKITVAAVAIIVGVLTTIAAVPGIFSSVDSTNGYKVAGSAGSFGDTLCSDGTYFNTPCSAASPFYQTVINGSHSADAVTQRGYLAVGPATGLYAFDVVGVGTQVGRTEVVLNTVNGSSDLATDGFAVVSNAGGTSGKPACWDGTNAGVQNCPSFIPRTCNVNGCYSEGPDGVIHEWGVTASFDTGPSSVTLPFSMPTALESVQVTQCFDASAGCSGGSTTTRQWESGSWSTTGFSVRNDGAGQARWDAWGH